MISAIYPLPESAPADGPDLASGLGWLHWTNFVLARAGDYPAAAHLAAFGWSDQFDALEHDLERMPHDEEIDPDTAAVSGQILAAVHARPDGAVEFRASTGEPDDGSGGDEEVSESAGPHKFSSTQIDLSGEAAYRLLELGRTVRDEDLAEDGRESEPHVTVRYGLHTEDAADVRPIVNAAGPIGIRLGAVSVFQVKKPDGRAFDVLKVDVESDGLRRLNRALAALPHTDTFSEYKPHATVAYVRPGSGATYAARMSPLNLDFTATRVSFSDRSDGRAVIPLLARAGEIREHGSLTQRKVTVHRSDGTTFERAQAVRSGDDVPGEGEKPSQPEVELHDSDRTAISDGIDRAAESLPAGAKAEGGLLEKVKDIALTAAAKVYMWAVRATPAMIKLGNILGEIFDTPSDMKKLGYNPNTSSGTANVQSVDPIKQSLQHEFGAGVGGHLVIGAAAQVLSRAVIWAKKKLTGKAQEDGASDGVREWAELIAALFASVAKSMGSEGAPDVDQVEKNLRGLLKARAA